MKNINNCISIHWFILFDIVIYIIHLEWYKRNYEKNLFNNPDDLFNLMTFIVTAEEKGLGIGEIKEKLREKSLYFIYWMSNSNAKLPQGRNHL